jgi:hypothetical protein
VRRLTRFWLLVVALGCGLPEWGCRRREPVRLQETDEDATALSSTVQMSDPKAAIQLLKGFHAIEQNAWRWTMANFSVTLKAPPGAGQKGATLMAKFTVPDAVISNVKSTTLTASLSGEKIGAATYQAPGDYTFNAEIAPKAIPSDSVTIDFALSKFLPAGSLDQRELGIVASMISLDPK